MHITYDQELAVIGQRIKFYREDAKLTTVAAAEKAGVSYATFCNAENGKLNLRMINFLKIVDSLGIPPQFFFRPINGKCDYLRDWKESEITKAIPDLSDINLEMLAEMAKILRQYSYNLSTMPSAADNNK